MQVLFVEWSEEKIPTLSSPLLSCNGFDLRRTQYLPLYILSLSLLFCMYVYVHVLCMQYACRCVGLVDLYIQDMLKDTQNQ